MGKIFLYGLFHEGKQIGFQCFANYTPPVKGKRTIFHFNRIVIHPDYQGLGLGIKFIDETCRLLLQENPDLRIMGKFSSVPVYKAMIKQKTWCFLGEKRQMGAMHYGNIDRGKTSFRDGGIKTFSFEWIGP